MTPKINNSSDFLTRLDNDLINDRVLTLEQINEIRKEENTYVLN